MCTFQELNALDSDKFVVALAEPRVQNVIRTTFSAVERSELALKLVIALNDMSADAYNAWRISGKPAGAKSCLPVTWQLKAIAQARSLAQPQLEQYDVKRQQELMVALKEYDDEIMRRWLVRDMPDVEDVDEAIRKIMLEAGAKNMPHAYHYAEYLRPYSDKFTEMGWVDNKRKPIDGMTILMVARRLRSPACTGHANCVQARRRR